jgi:hypothetical protein
MKKLVLSLTVLMLTAFNLFSQNDDEKRLNVKPIEPAQLPVVPNLNIDCNCVKNILQDGGFQNVTTYYPLNTNITPASTPWKPQAGSPQWTANPVGPCNSGTVYMWGNNSVWESIIQNITPVTAGHKFKIKVTARFINPINNNYVNLKIIAGANVVGTINITNQGWATYTIPCWSSPVNFSSIELHPETNNADVSWVQIDNICMEECCDCSHIPQKPPITGPTCFCLPHPCNQTLTYSVPNFGGLPCVSYTWNINPIVAFNGQGTNQISFNCSALAAGTYTITVTIKCSGLVFINTIQLVVCDKPDPAFTMSSSGNSVTLTSASLCNNYWLLVNDNDNNCAYTNGEPYQFLATNPATFTGLVNNQQYVVYHFVMCKCCNNYNCRSSKIMCFKWLPSQLTKIGNGAKGVELLSEKEILKAEEIPAIFRKDLPKEIFKEFDKVEITEKD